MYAWPSSSTNTPGSKSHGTSSALQVGVSLEISLFPIGSFHGPVGESAKNWLPGGYVKGGYPKDSWDNDLQYVMPGTNGRTFDLYSFGADGQSGGEGTDADIYYQP